VRFRPTSLEGAFLIELERKSDERGFFARTWCEEEFRRHGLNWRLVQGNVSYNHRKGTLRGLHLQGAPKPEAKLVRCTRGAIFDVAVDLRPGSTTFGKWTAVELTADNQLALFIPEGFAHGFQTLTDDSEVFYQMSEFYCREAARGVRWDDPTLGITWPECDQRILSPQDQSWPLLKDEDSHERQRRIAPPSRN
jgi:dTDP-4-dehydrorhamnose 3,5-epimerase